MNPTNTKELSMKANALWNTFGCIFYLGCQWLITVLVVTLSNGYGNSGALSLAMSVGLIFTAIGSYNMRTYQVSDTKNRYSDSRYIAFRFLTLFLSLGICIVYSFVTYKDVQIFETCICYLVFKFDETFVDVIYGIYQKNLRMDYIGKSQILRGFLSLSLFSIGLIFTSNLKMSILLMSFGCVLVTILFDRKHLQLFYRGIPKIDTATAKSMIITCTPVMIACLFNTAIASASRQLFGVNQGTELLGIYSALATPAVLIQAGITYIYSPWISSLSRNLASDKRLFKRNLNKLVLALIGMTILGTVLLAPLGTHLLPLVYPNINNYIWTFPFVLLATSATAVFGLIHNCLIINRSLITLVVVNAGALILALATQAPLVSACGLNGLNLSLLLSYTTASVAGYLCLLYKLK